MMNWKFLCLLFVIFWHNCSLTYAQNDKPGDKVKKGLIVVDTGSGENSNGEDEAKSEDEEAGEHQTFHPTKEWKPIKPGQAIPQGLHVRINLQTGEKEAKLNEDNAQSIENEPNDAETEAELVAKISKDGLTRESKKFTQEDLRSALKNIKSDDMVELTAKEIQKIREKFRSIDDLKKEFSEMQMSVKTNTELMRELIDDYKQANDKKKWLILDNMEYLVHQFDVAQDFVDMGGIELLLSDLNSTNSSIRSHAAFTIGSASQGNPKVQIAVLESGALQHLLRLVSLDPNHQVQSSALYAISCLVRQFPLAQYRFAQSGGLSVFVDLFKASDIQSMRLQLKVVTLLHDLIMEQHLTAVNYQKDDKLQKEKLKQYEIFPVLDSFVQHGFCSLVPKLLKSPELDTQEKVIKTMLSVVHVCHEEFKSSVELLRELIKMYGLAAEKESGVPADVHSSDPMLESGDYYFTLLKKLASELLTKVTGYIKDEL